MKTLVTTALTLMIAISSTAHARKKNTAPAPTPTPITQTNRAACYVQTLSANYQIYVGFEDKFGESKVQIDRLDGSGIQATTISIFNATRDYNVAANDEAYLASNFDLVIHTQSPDLNGIPGDLNGFIDGIEVSKYVSCGLYYK